MSQQIKNLTRAKTALFLLSTFLILGCSSVSGVKATRTPAQVAALDALTQEMALQRSAQLQNVKYELFIDVSNGSESFAGEQRIVFDLKKAEDVWLDFHGGSISSAIVNGIATPLSRGPIHVRLPKETLVVGTNSAEIHFQHNYSRSGSGLHRFLDPEDKKVYLYTDFEPFDANQWAPFFDQPDIKAPLTLTVKAPIDWAVSANTLHRHIQKTKTTATWTFSPTAPISSYLYAMVAGPFVIWQDQYRDIPLRIFARQSLARYVQYKEWFDITKQGFEFYEKYFGVNYPFQKYDQLIVPEFNAGAMENVGAVTFSEKYIPRGQYTRKERNRIASVVLHEMAHMWFGNLVTMKWWNDLWLNESFATYMSSLAKANATIFKEAWVNFRVAKNEAYDMDQTIVTHPISGAIHNTNEAFNNFDDITYKKGASVMKALRHYVSPEAFRQSLRRYFQKYSYKNTTLTDFIAVFEETMNKDMTPWFRDWLETSGVDTIKQSFNCKPEQLTDRKVTKLTVTLGLSRNSRPHAINAVAFKQNKSGQLVPIAELTFKTASGESKVSAEATLEGENRCPDFVYANFQDQGYLKVELDSVSLQFILNNINRIQNSELRIGLWSELWEMVRDQKLRIKQFSALALKALAVESDTDVLNFLISKTIGSEDSGFDTVYYYWPQTLEPERVVLQQLTESFETVLHTRLVNAKTKAPELVDQYKLFFTSYLTSIRSSAGVARAVQMLSQTHDPDLRWNALYALSRENYASIDKLIAEELTSDRSDKALKNALACRVVKPDLKQKEFYLKSVTTNNQMPYSADELALVSRHLFPARQRALLANYRRQIYNSIKEVWPQFEGHAQKQLANNLAPTDCSAEMNRELQNLVSGANALPEKMLKPLRRKFDSDRRCIAIRKYNRAMNLPTQN